MQSFIDICSSLKSEKDKFFQIFPTVGVQNLFFPGRYLPVDVFFPVFPTLGVQNLFFPGRYLPVFTTVNTGSRADPGFEVRGGANGLENF